MKLIQIKDYLFLIDEEAEIKEGNYRVHIYEKTLNHPVHRLEHGENTFDTWKLVLAYYPLTKEAKELDLPLLPNPFEKDNNVEKLALEHIKIVHTNNSLSIDDVLLDYTKRNIFKSFIAGYKAAFKQFSLEDMQKAIEMARLMTDDGVDVFDTESISGLTELCTYGLRDKYSEEEIIQLLSTQQFPKEFIPDTEIVYASKGLADKDFIYEEVFKTITNSEGKQELVGTYKY